MSDVGLQKSATHEQNNESQENNGCENRIVNKASGIRSDVNRSKKNVQFYCSGKHPSVIYGKKLLVFNAYVKAFIRQHIS